MSGLAPNNYIPSSLCNKTINFYTNNALAGWFDSYGCLVIGNTTGSGGNGYKLRCVGGTALFGTGIHLGGTAGVSNIAGCVNLHSTGTITCSTLTASVNNFLIDNPTNPKMKLRHRCVEAPTSLNLYRGVQSCNVGINDIMTVSILTRTCGLVRLIVSALVMERCKVLW